MHNSSLSGLLRGIQNRQQDCGVSWNSHKATKTIDLTTFWGGLDLNCSFPRTAPQRIEQMLQEKQQVAEQMLQNRLIYRFVTETHQKLLADIAEASRKFFGET